MSRLLVRSMLVSQARAGWRPRWTARSSSLKTVWGASYVEAHGRYALPTLPSLLIKSTLLGGGSGRNELREGSDLYINPPMREFGFLDWQRIYAMVDVGYRHGQQCVRAWLDTHPEMQRRDESPGLPRTAMAL